MAKLGDRVLMPDLYPGRVEEIDGDQARVRHEAWDGGPSCLSSWCMLDVLKPCPMGFIAPQPTVQQRLDAADLWDRLEDALESLDAKNA